MIVKSPYLIYTQSLSAALSFFIHTHIWWCDAQLPSLPQKNFRLKADSLCVSRWSFLLRRSKAVRYPDGLLYVEFFLYFSLSGLLLLLLSFDNQPT